MHRTARLLTIAVAALSALGTGAAAATAAPTIVLADETVTYEANNVPGRFVLTKKRVNLSPTKRWVMRITLYSDPQRDGTLEKIKTFNVDYAKKGFKLLSFDVEPQHNQGRVDMTWKRTGTAKVRDAHFIGRDDRFFRFDPDAP